MSLMSGRLFLAMAVGVLTSCLFIFSIVPATTYTTAIVDVAENAPLSILPCSNG